MTDLFVDAGGWIALADAADRHHALAASAYPGFLVRYQGMLTTTLVIAETYISLRIGVGHAAAVRFLDQIESSPRIFRINVNRQLEQAAEEILRTFSDQRFSYTDAVSFAVMRSHKLTDAFAFDRHFAAAGFVRVPSA